MTGKRWRVTTGGRCFSLERFSHIDKDGAEVWVHEAFCRSRRDLLSSLRVRGLSADLAADVPAHHHDAYRALSNVQEPGRVLSDAQRAALEKAHAAKRAKRMTP